MSETTIYASNHKGDIVPFAEGPLLDFIWITHRETRSGQDKGQPGLKPFASAFGGSVTGHVRQPRAQLAARIPESVFVAITSVVTSHGLRMCSRRGGPSFQNHLRSSSSSISASQIPMGSRSLSRSRRPLQRLATRPWPAETAVVHTNTPNSNTASVQTQGG